MFIGTKLLGTMVRVIWRVVDRISLFELHCWTYNPLGHPVHESQSHGTAIETGLKQPVKLWILRSLFE